MGESMLDIIPLGAGSEVGRSCIVLQYKGRTVMFDCGVHPAKKGKDALPLFDKIDPRTVDAVLVTHCHLDHCAALPYFLSRTSFAGEVLMTLPTKLMLDLVLRDYVKMVHSRNDDDDNNNSNNAAGATTATATTTGESSTAPIPEGNGNNGVPAAAAATSAAPAAPTVKVITDPDGMPLTLADQSDSGLDETPLYTEADLQSAMDRIHTIKFGEEVSVAGMKVTCYNAGHILGAAMFLVEIGGKSVLYTGDFSREEDHHLLAATVPPERRVDVLVCESTYGVQVHTPRKARERRFTGWVRDIVARGGRCLVPVFAIGRAQELLLILEEYWRLHPELHSVPVYCVSAIAERCLAIYKTSRAFMNSNVQLRQAATSRVHAQGMTTEDPFDFHYVKFTSTDAFVDAGPCVVVASPGMLQSGVSRHFYDKWHDNPLNGIVFPGYCVRNSFAYPIVTGRVPIRASVQEVSFSAHADFKQTSDFVRQVQPRYVVLVHGEAHEMDRLRVELVRLYGSRMTVFAPKTNQRVRLAMPSQDSAVKIIGALAAETHGALFGTSCSCSSSTGNGDSRSGSGDSDGNNKDGENNDDSEKMKDDGDNEEENESNNGSSSSSSTEPPPQKRAATPIAVSGFLVCHDGAYTLTNARDLPSFAQLRTAQIRQCAEVPFAPALRLLAVALNDACGRRGAGSSRAVRYDAAAQRIDVAGRVRLTRRDRATLALEWMGGAVNDLLADAAAATALALETDTAALLRARHLAEQCSDSCDDGCDGGDDSGDGESAAARARMRAVCLAVLRRHYGAAEARADDPDVIVVDTPLMHATLTLPAFSVTCDNSRQIAALHRFAVLLRDTLRPMALPEPANAATNAPASVPKREPDSPVAVAPKMEADVSMSEDASPPEVPSVLKTRVKIEQG